VLSGSDIGGVGGLLSRPADFAIDTHARGWSQCLRRFEANTVTSIVGFTEIERGERLYNSAAVLQNGRVAGCIASFYPAMS